MVHNHIARLAVFLLEKSAPERPVVFMSETDRTVQNIIPTAQKAETNNVKL